MTATGASNENESLNMGTLEKNKKNKSKENVDYRQIVNSVAKLMSNDLSNPETSIVDISQRKIIVYLQEILNKEQNNSSLKDHFLALLKGILGKENITAEDITEEALFNIKIDGISLVDSIQNKALFDQNFEKQFQTKLESKIKDKFLDNLKSALDKIGFNSDESFLYVVFGKKVKNLTISDIKGLDLVRFRENLIRQGVSIGINVSAIDGFFEDYGILWGSYKMEEILDSIGVKEDVKSKLGNTSFLKTVMSSSNKNMHTFRSLIQVKFSEFIEQQFSLDLNPTLDLKDLSQGKLSYQTIYHKEYSEFISIVNQLRKGRLSNEDESKLFVGISSDEKTKFSLQSHGEYDSELFYKVLSSFIKTNYPAKYIDPSNITETTRQQVFKIWKDTFSENFSSIEKFMEGTLLGGEQSKDFTVNLIKGLEYPISKFPSRKYSQDKKNYSSEYTDSHIDIKFYPKNSNFTKLFNDAYFQIDFLIDPTDASFISQDKLSINGQTFYRNQKIIVETSSKQTFEGFLIGEDNGKIGLDNGTSTPTEILLKNIKSVNVHPQGQRVDLSFSQIYQRIVSEELNFDLPDNLIIDMEELIGDSDRSIVSNNMFKDFYLSEFSDNVPENLKNKDPQAWNDEEGKFYYRIKHAKALGINDISGTKGNTLFEGQPLKEFIRSKENEIIISKAEELKKKFGVEITLVNGFLRYNGFSLMTYLSKDKTNGEKLKIEIEQLKATTVGAKLMEFMKNAKGHESTHRYLESYNIKNISIKLNQNGKDISRVFWQENLCQIVDGSYERINGERLSDEVLEKIESEIKNRIRLFNPKEADEFKFNGKAIRQLDTKRIKSIDDYSKLSREEAAAMTGYSALPSNEVQAIYDSFLKLPNASATDFNDLNTNFGLTEKASALKVFVENYSSGILHSISGQIYQNYKSTLEGLNIQSQASDKEIVWDIAKQYYYFLKKSDSAIIADQNSRGYSIENPKDSQSKQLEIENRMIGSSVFKAYRNGNIQRKTEILSKFDRNNPNFVQLESLLNKDPASNRFSTPKRPDELSSRDLAILGSLIKECKLRVSDSQSVGGVADSGESTEPEYESNFKALNKSYQAIKGLGTDEFGEGSSFYLKLKAKDETWNAPGDDGKDKTIPMGNDYYRMTIKSFNKKTGKAIIEYQMINSEKKFTIKNTNLYSLCSDGECTLFDTIKSDSKLGVDGIIRINKVAPDKEGFKTLLGSSYGEAKEVLGKLSPEWTSKSVKLDSITHVGKKFSVAKRKVKINGKEEERPVNGGLFFKVKFNGNSVDVDGGSQGGGFKKNMSYEEFLVFVGDKGLDPFDSDSKKDLEDTLVPVETSQKKVFSPLGILANAVYIPVVLGIKMAFSPKDAGKQIYEKLGLKKVMDDVMWQRKQKQQLKEIEASRFFAHLFGSTLGNVPGLGASFKYVGSEFDGQVTSSRQKIVNDFKERLSKGGEPDDITKMIYDEMLSSDGKALKAFRDDFSRYRALAAYMYCLEKGGPYLRKASDAEGSGRWVAALMGPAWFEKFKQHREEKIKAANSGEMAQLVDLSLLEYRFIASNMGKLVDSGYYFTALGSKLENEIDKMKNGLEDTYKGVNGKGDYAEIFGGAYKGLFNGARYPGWLGAMRALVENTESDVDYPNTYGAMVFYSIISAQYRGYNQKDMMDFVDGMAKNTGFDFVVMSTNGVYNPEKVARLFDAVSKSAGITPPFIEATKYNYDKMLKGDGDKTRHKVNKEYFDEFWKWWKSNGNTIIDAMNMSKDKSILTYAAKDTPEGKIIKEYVTASNSSLFSASEAGDPINQGQGRAYWGPNVWHYSPATFRQYMLELDTKGRFSGKSERYGPKLWGYVGDALKQKNNQYNDMSEEEKKIFKEFLFNRLKTWFVSSRRFLSEQEFMALFGRYFDKASSESRASFITKSGDKKYAKLSTGQYMLKKLNANVGEIHGSIRQTFEEVDKILDTISGGSYRGDTIYNIYEIPVNENQQQNQVRPQLAA